MKLFYVRCAVAGATTGGLITWINGGADSLPVWPLWLAALAIVEAVAYVRRRQRARTHHEAAWEEWPKY